MAHMSALDRCKHFGVSNIQGMAYMPGPSNYTKTSGRGTLYENSDFYNNIFTELWGCNAQAPGGSAGRDDLRRFQEQLGVNFIHCYDWAAPVEQKDQDGKLLKLLSHMPFLEACTAHEMTATIPISNYTMDLLSQGETDKAHKNVNGVIAEIYPETAGASMLKIFNEYELWFDKKPEHVVTVMQWIAEWEDSNDVADDARLPVMVCTSFGVKDGIEGAGYMKDVWNVLRQKPSIGSYDPVQFWKERVVFATNPQREGAAIIDYLETRLPGYWAKSGIPVPPVMFTELGSSTEQTGGEDQQAEWLSGQIAASRPGSSGGMMLGACVFLNEERPWEDGPEKSFGIMRFAADDTWGEPKQNYTADTAFPVWDPRGWFWAKPAQYPVEQQARKPNYASVAKAWLP